MKNSLFLFWFAAQNLFIYSTDAKVLEKPTAAAKLPSKFRGGPDRVSIIIDQTFNGILPQPNKPTDVQVSPLISQGVVVLSFTAGNATADSVDEKYSVICSYDYQCSNTTSLGWSAPAAGRNASQNYANGLPVNNNNGPNSPAYNGYYCMVSVTNSLNQTACSDPVLLTKPPKPTGVSSGASDVWTTTWQDGWPAANPPETYRAKCVKQGTGCNGESLGYTMTLIPRGVGKATVGGLPLGYVDCYIVANNVVGDTCSDVIPVIMSPPICSTTPPPNSANTAFFINRGTGNPSHIGKVTQCPIVNSVLQGTGCFNPPAATGFFQSRGIIRYGSSLFVSIGGSDTMQECTLSGGTVSSCGPAAGGYIFPNSPVGMLIKDSYMYVTIAVTGTISVCQLSGSSIISCSNPPAPPSGWNLQNGYGIVNIGNTLYISDKFANSIVMCTISSPGVIGSCSIPPTPDSGWKLNQPAYMSLTGCTLYIANGVGDYITQCTIDPYTQLITNCYVPLPPPYSSLAVARAINLVGNLSYVSNQEEGSSNPVTKCTMLNGVIQSCAPDSTILDALSLKAVRHRLDKRKLQEELDLHRLYLITAYHHRHLTHPTHLSEEIASILDAEAQKLGSDGLRSQVSGFLSQQLYHFTKTMDRALGPSGANDDGPSQALAHLWRQQQEETADAALQGPLTPRNSSSKSSGLGLGFAAAAAAAAAQEEADEKVAGRSGGESFTQKPPHLTLKQVSEAFLSLANFTLHVSPSSITHSAAGQGLFLNGTASVGQIVALYPGVTYSPLYHRHIPGYPLVARSNPFLLSRFDGVVLDAKPWGNGGFVEEGSSGGGDEKINLPLSPQNAAEEALFSHLERRNPLAFAHYANHPPAGMLPNVMVAAVDWNNLPKKKESSTAAVAGEEAEGDKEKIISGGGGELRAYIPVIDFCSTSSSTTPSAAGRAAENLMNKKNSCDVEANSIQNALPRKSDIAPCVALVALRDLDNEELFLNYRLNPNAPGGLPDWYSPVDLEEDTRRWA